MNPGLLGGIIGSVIGLAGGIAGMCASVRRAASARERRYVICSSVAFLLGISGYLVALYLVPHRYHLFIEIAYAVALPMGVLANIRGHRRITAGGTDPASTGKH